MRVLTAIFTFLVTLAVVCGLGFLITREVLLQIAVSQLKSDISQLQRVARNTGSYIQECQKKGSNTLDGRVIDGIQLRFTSPTEYQLEVICSQYSLDPVLVESKELPWLVRKEAGGSGIRWQVEPSAVSVTLWGRTRSLGVEDEQLVEGLSPTEIGTAFSPVTSCSGYGYTCCQAETSLGEGTQITTATDCPRTCYTSCAARPIILSVTTQPFFDQVTRTVTVGRGEEVSIGYVMDAAGLEGVTTTVDFGDGEQASFTEINGSAPHTYQCTQGSCQYNVQVQATAANGAASAATPITQLTVLVQ
jgi:hypothetical protein